MKKLTFDEAKIKARQFCAKRERNPGEMIQKIRSWQRTLEEAKDIVSCLKEEDFINEKRYASAFVNDKIKFDKWGKLRVSHYLKMVGIDEKYFNQVVDRIDDDEYCSMIRRELEKKSRQIKHDDKNSFRLAILRFSSNRGYESDIVDPLINEFF